MNQPTPAANNGAAQAAWNVDRALRLMAGFFTLLSVVLAAVVSPKWLYFAGFVGLNLLQSAFTNWCPAMTLLRKAGLKG